MCSTQRKNVQPLQAVGFTSHNHRAGLPIVCPWMTNWASLSLELQCVGDALQNKQTGPPPTHTPFIRLCMCACVGRWTCVLMCIVGVYTTKERPWLYCFYLWLSKNRIQVSLNNWHNKSSGMPFMSLHLGGASVEGCIVQRDLKESQEMVSIITESKCLAPLPCNWQAD